jgi:hypothetical protein
MIAVILSACLLNEPSVCREHRIVLSSEISAMRCMVSAMPHVAHWAEEHPTWRVVRWQCRPVSQKEI